MPVPHPSDPMSVEASMAMKPDTVEPGPVLEPIAVIGIGCRLPGARGPRQLWDLLCNGIDAVGELPEGRFGPTARPEAVRPSSLSGRIASPAGGFLETGPGGSYVLISEMEACAKVLALTALDVCGIAA